MSNNVNPRRLAVTALCRVDDEGAYSNITLNSLLNSVQLSSADKALCTMIFYGTLDRRITIDYILKQFVKTGITKLKPFTLNLLRSAVYQIKFMDKIPDSAAVNESVKIIKGSKESYNSGFVNGVLRNIARTEIALPNGDGTADLSVRYSAPEWLVATLVSDYSSETASKILENALTPPLTFIRVNTSKVDCKQLQTLLKEEGVNVEQTDLTDTFVISDYSSITSLKSYKDGLFFVQDIACQKAIRMLGIEDNDRIYDMCSAPGGKSFSAALSAQNVKILATDIYKNRVNLITKGTKRLGLCDKITATVQDATEYNNSYGFFNKIICDVPCSGLGVLRRKPDIKYNDVTDFDSLAKTQFNILSNADKYLETGGKILYSTCTLRRAENEEIVYKFLKEFDNYKITDMKTFLPHIDNSDGFFAAILQKQ